MLWGVPVTREGMVPRHWSAGSVPNTLPAQSQGDPVPALCRHRVSSRSFTPPGLCSSDSTGLVHTQHRPNASLRIKNEKVHTSTKTALLPQCLVLHLHSLVLLVLFLVPQMLSGKTARLTELPSTRVSLSAQPADGKERNRAQELRTRFSSSTPGQACTWNASSSRCPDFQTVSLQRGAFFFFF